MSLAVTIPKRESFSVNPSLLIFFDAIIFAASFVSYTNKLVREADIDVSAS